MHRFDFTLALSAEQTRLIYAGRARYILVEDSRGLKLQIPAGNFRGFVDGDGIHGAFRVVTDGQNRIRSLQRL